MSVLISLTALGTLTMFGGVFRMRSLVLILTIIGIVTALVLDIAAWNSSISYFNNMMRVDNFTVSFIALSLLGSLLFFLFYYDFYFHQSEYLAEVFPLITFSLAGVVVLVSFTNLLMLFLGIEILSLSLYVLAGIRKNDLLSNEASMKYFLMGAFSTGILLFGMAMIYGATGSFFTNDIALFITSHNAVANPFIVAGIILLMIGLFFKVAAAPFHFWTPDVYQGSPTLVTAYMATIGKIAAFAAFLRLFQLSFADSRESYEQIFWIVSVTTMFAGNIIAIYQNNVKRMLAYSSIAHAGYLLIAMLALNDMAASAVLFYSIAYLLASFSAFVVLMIVAEKRKSEQIESFNGLAKSNPMLALVFAVAMISLSGIPPTAGFFAKFYIFSAAIKDGWIWLVILAIINSFISVYYYFRPVIASYMKAGHEEKISINLTTSVLLILLSLLTIIIGVIPGWFIGILR